MCRLMGAVFFTDQDYKRNPMMLKDYFASLFLFGEQANGGDGNGVAITFPDSNRIYKTPSKTYNFLYDHTHRRRYGKPYQKLMCGVQDAYSVMLHTRLTTNGSSKNLSNLHPFICGDVVGCHNGTITNFKELWAENKDLKAESENDSEVIFALLNKNVPALDDTDKIKDVFRKLKGYMAITATSKQNPNRVVLVSRERPLCYYIDKRDGILWYASTPTILAMSGICEEKDATKLQEEGIIVDSHTTEIVKFVCNKATNYYGGTTYYSGSSEYGDWNGNRWNRYTSSSTETKKGKKRSCTTCDGNRVISTLDLHRTYTDKQIDRMLSELPIHVEFGEVFVECPTCSAQKPERVTVGDEDTVVLPTA